MIIGSNFNYSSRKYLDDRQECESLETLINNPKGLLYPQGFEVYCLKEKQWYYNASDNKEGLPIWRIRKNNYDDTQLKKDIENNIKEIDNIVNNFSTEQIDNQFKIKYKDIEIASIPINITTENPV